MIKLSYKDKINLYNDRKSRMTIKSLKLKYGIREERIEYLVRLIDKHGFDILRKNKNKYYSPYQKEQIINRVLNENDGSNR